MSRRRPNWVNASVKLPSTVRITTESLDPRIENNEYNKRDHVMSIQQATSLIERCFESVEIAKYEHMICSSQSEPFWVEVKKAIDIIEEMSDD